MCEVCNNRYSNCPACCDSEPDNLEAPEAEKNRPMPVASQETIDAMQNLFIKRQITYTESTELYYTYRLYCKGIIEDFGDELFISQMCIIFGELMTGTFTPDMIKEVMINRINTPKQ